MAAQIKAKVTKVPTDHLAMLVDPKAVTAVIVEAADKVQSGKATAGWAPGAGSAGRGGHVAALAEAIASPAPAFITRLRRCRAA
jgi:hypothetical protein